MDQAKLKEMKQLIARANYLLDEAYDAHCRATQQKAA